MRYLMMALASLSMVGAFHGSAHAQSVGYQYTLNGRVVSTNPDTMSGPYGCRSELRNIRTEQMYCGLDGIVSPESVWAGEIAKFCGGGRGEYTPQPSRCTGGILAVGQNCRRLPHTCSYYRILRAYDQEGSWDVREQYIWQRGSELWIARPGSREWSSFVRCHAAQFTGYFNPQQCY